MRRGVQVCRNTVRISETTFDFCRYSWLVMKPGRVITTFSPNNSPRTFYSFAIPKCSSVSQTVLGTLTRCHPLTTSMAAALEIQTYLGPTFKTNSKIFTQEIHGKRNRANLETCQSALVFERTSVHNLVTFIFKLFQQIQTYTMWSKYLESYLKILYNFVSPFISNTRRYNVGQPLALMTDCILVGKLSIS